VKIEKEKIANACNSKQDIGFVQTRPVSVVTCRPYMYIVTGKNARKIDLKLIHGV